MLAAVLTTAAAAAAHPPAAVVRDEARTQASPSLVRLTRERIVLGFNGYAPPHSLLSQVHRGHAGGVILYSQNVRSRGQVRHAVRTIQRARPRGEPPVLVLIDQEGGLVKRLPGAPSHSAEEMGRDGRSSLVRREGRATARNLRGAGVNLDLAPVADLGRAGSNIAATHRAFGSDPRSVGRLARAFAGGLRSGRVAATAKHFPGIGGATSADADTTRTVIRLSRHRLRTEDERPFRTLATARVPVVMLSSAIYSAFGGARALFSRRIATDELRRRLGFRGVSLADDLDAPLLTSMGTPGNRAVRAARAGADLIMFAHSIPDARAGGQALVGAIRDGRLSRAEAKAAARRVRALREHLAG